MADNKFCLTGQGTLAIGVWKKHSKTSIKRQEVQPAGGTLSLQVTQNNASDAPNVGTLSLLSQQTLFRGPDT